jgi:hypothetical protein
MKLKSICVLLILACGSLLASPRKYPCPEREAAAARIIKANAGTAMAVDTDLLPIHRFSGTVL